jgi:succinate-semialdehyde dehydrogenase/glutarate-semialdehyde dehydrogenase
VQRSVYAAFLEKFAQATNQLIVGDGMQADVTIGPLINKKALQKVERLVQDATEKGARVLTGGKAISDTFYAPTVLAEVPVHMDINREEIFGPVAAVSAFDTEAEVIQQANDTPYGLAAYFYGRDISRVFRVSDALEYGMVGVNTGIMGTAIAPFGGIKESGIGREGSKYGIEEFMNIKYTCIAGI